MGWFDAVASRYGCRIQGSTEVALTVLDVLGYLDELHVCVGYEIDGEVTKDFPTTVRLERAKPVYETLPGWKCEIRGIKKYEDRPYLLAENERRPNPVKEPSGFGRLFSIRCFCLFPQDLRACTPVEKHTI